jgi:acyl-CoA thioesterase
MSLTREQIEQLKEKRNDTNYFSKYNGIFIKELEDGHALVEMVVDQNKKNPIGTVHGGAVFTMCDNAGGAAATSLGSAVTTVDANIHYLRPTLNKTLLRAVSTVRKNGKNIVVCDVSLQDQDGLELAYGTFTYMKLEHTYAEMGISK